MEEPATGLGSSPEKNALLALASGNESLFTHEKESLFDYQVDIFNTTMDLLLQSPDFERHICEVLRKALRYCSYDLVHRLLDKCNDHGIPALVHYPLVLQDAVQYYGKLPNGRRRYRQGVADHAEGVRESDKLVDLVRLLIQHEAQLNSRDDCDKTALFWVVERGFHRTFDVLLEAGAVATLSYSASAGSPDILQLAVQRLQANSGLTDWSKNLNWYESIHTRWPYMILRLLKLGLRADAMTIILPSLVTAFCQKGSIHEVEVLIDLSEGCNKLTSSLHGRGISPLHAATMHGNTNIVVFLIKRGMSPSTKCDVDIHGDNIHVFGMSQIAKMCTPISAALRKVSGFGLGFGQILSEAVCDCCEILLDAGAEAADGKALMMYYVQKKQLDRLVRLLNKGHRLECVPLCNDPRLISVLCNHGATIDLPLFLDYALGVERGFPGGNISFVLLRYLVEQHGQQIRARYFGETACILMCAARDRAEAIQMLYYIMTGMEYDVNSVFAFHESDGSKRNKREYLDHLGPNAYKSSYFDMPVDGEQTNLFQLACLGQHSDFADSLLRNGADPKCPGLCETALEFYLTYLRESERAMDTSFVTTLMKHDQYNNLETIGLLISYHKDLEKVPESKLLKDILERDGAITLVREAYEEKIQVFYASLKSLRPIAYQQFYPKVVSGPEDLLKLSTCGTEQFKRKYLHKELEGPRSIRLVEIMPASNLANPLVCALTHSELSESTSFEALSYAWGDPTNTVAISVNDAEFHVTKNLLNALQRLRYSKGSRRLWIDAICINQNDNHEKAQQIALMRDIYISAERTLMWIGETSVEIDEAFAHPWLHDDISRRALEPPSFDAEVEVAFASLIDRPYFSRTWTIQEYSLAKEALIVCGPHSCTFYSFLRMIEKYKWLPLPKSVYEPRMDDWLRCTVVPRTVYTVPEVIELIKFSHASDAKDKVFGILGMMERQLIPIDYSWSVERIYMEFTKAVILRNKSLEVWHWLGFNRSQWKLRSWVPDWSTSRPVGILGRELRSPTPCKGLKFIGEKLLVRGKLIDQIGKITVTFPELRETSSNNGDRDTEALKHWESFIFDLTHTRGPSILTAFAAVLEGWRERDTRWQTDGSSGRAYGSFLQYVIWDSMHGAGILKSRQHQEFEAAEIIMALSKYTSKPQLVSYDHYATSVNRICRGRKLFVTANGSLGLAPPCAMIGDTIAFFPGTYYAVVIRPSADAWELVGDCVLEGLDTREFCDKKNEIFLEEFVFI